MAKTLPLDAGFNIADPKNRLKTMLDDVDLLYRHERFTSCACLIMCFLDALASPGATSDRGAFTTFMSANFQELCAGFDNRVPGKRGSDLIYDRIRNGLAHMFAPKVGFALGRDSELDGVYVEEVFLGTTGPFVTLNVDRLKTEFTRLVSRLADAAA